jgi:hypothetical protein
MDRFDSGDIVQGRRLFLATWAVASAFLVSFGCNEPTKVVEPPAAQAVNDAQSEDALIQLLAKAYRHQDCELFADLFPAPEDSVEYTFVFNQLMGGLPSWGRDAELYAHGQMFRCDSIVPPTELRLVNISIQLNRVSPAWIERTDLYHSAGNPTGLDASRWRATEAEFHADILFETQGDTDYRIDSRTSFIVIQDLGKPVGATRRYLIYRWEELDPALPIDSGDPSIRTAPVSWGAIKFMYRHWRG